MNGAGKTSTFKMITGQEDLSSGEVIINKINLLHNKKKVSDSWFFFNQKIVSYRILDFLKNCEKKNFY